MKIALTAKGQLKKQIDSIRKQQLFKNGMLQEPRGEYVISLNLDTPGRQVSGHTAVQYLYHYVSDKKAKLTWRALAGVSTYEHEINQEKLNALLTETESRIKISGYEGANWLDVLVFSLVFEIFPEDSTTYDWAKFHFNNLLALDDRIQDAATVFCGVYTWPLR